MSYRLIHRPPLLAALSVSTALMCFAAVAIAQSNTYSLVPCKLDPNEQCIRIILPCTEPARYGNAGWYFDSCDDDDIQIPNGRPIYAFLVNGFDQNHNFNMFHFYNFAKHIFELTDTLDKKSYVHFAWWNNLLAPYMERPLHNIASVPSKTFGALEATWDYLGFLYDPHTPPPIDPSGETSLPTKAVPAEDYQFQKDAKAVLEAIRELNPNAVIILVGHSMGGDAIIRLADSMPADFAIDLLAPIDPVGNRTCLPNVPIENPVDMEWYNTTCYGAYNFTRFQATHTDWYWYPDRISFKDNNIEYLYYRWQTEAAFPFDYGCPNVPLLCPLQAHMRTLPQDESALPDRYLFRHEKEPATSGLCEGSCFNVQSRVSTSLWSGTEVFPNWYWFWNWGGMSDGHGEIVGFRALDPTNILRSYPLALAARGDWPSRNKEDLNNPDDSTRRDRIDILRAWEADSHYLEDPEDSDTPFAPEKPDLCLVSNDLSSILDQIFKGHAPQPNQAPVADANGPYRLECVGEATTVSLDGSGSSDPEGSTLEYFWHTDCPGLSPDNPVATFDDPKNPRPVLTVSTSNGCPVSCIAELTATDTLGKAAYGTADILINDTLGPDISCPADTSIECDEAATPYHTGAPIVSDACDSNPDVIFSDVTIPGECPQERTIRRTWTATDNCGNASSCAQSIAVVDTTPPVIVSVSAAPAVLWPPDHQMKPISVEAMAMDNCDPKPACRIKSVVSNEPMDGQGDGNMSADWEIRGSLDLTLRAERAGSGGGRDYTITVECTDARNNSATVDTKVSVSHDSGEKKDSRK